MRGRWRRGATAVGVGLALVAAGCSSGDSGDTTGDKGGPAPSAEKEDAPRAKPDPVLTAVSDLLDGEGLLSLDAAQRLFAATVAPLPGVEPADIPEQAGSNVAEMAIRRLRAGLAELSPEVAAAFTTALEADVEVEEFEVPRGGELPTREELAAYVAPIIADFDARSGHALGIPIRLRVVRDRRSYWAYADGIGSGRRASACRISLTRSVAESLGDESSRSTVAHEVWHCYQLDVSRNAFDAGPSWVIEGQAEWVGEEYVGGTGSSASRWNTWLGDPGRSLFGRSYDAIGVYAEAEDQGANPWQTMLPMLGQGSLAAVETLFGAAPDGSVRAVAEALVRRPAINHDWESTGPGITGATGAADLLIRDDEPTRVSASVGRFATLPVALSIGEGDVLLVSVSGGAAGAVGFAEVGTMPLGGSGTAVFCHRPEGCECPDGSYPGGGGPLPEMLGDSGGAAVGAIDGAELVVSGFLLSLEEACNGLVGTWTADVGTVLGILTAPYGGGAPPCSGPYTLAFGLDLSFALGAQGRCSFGDEAGAFDLGFTGTYTSTPTEFTVANIAGEGEARVVIAGRTVAIPVLEGFRQAFSQATPYTIESDVLTFSFSAPDGNRFTLTFTRVS